jgi:AraC-like DNA-binding protein
MTESPGNFADRPIDDQFPIGLTTDKGDLLSELLSTVRLRGTQILDCAPTPPFSIAFDHPGGALHIIQSGSIELDILGDGAGRHFQRGDVVLLPAGERHTIRSASAALPHAGSSPDSPPAAIGEDVGARWLSGTFAFDDARAARLMSCLPSVIELRGIGGQSLVWLDVSCQMLAHEINSPSQGSLVMISRILDLLFIQALRAWATRSDAQPGWLTGAIDPVIGKAISAIHANPRQRWTVKRLAGESSLSRSAFAERFTQLVGQPPASYLTEIRLALATDLLRETSDPIRTIAAHVGYESDAAFSRVFQRRHGLPPSRWRRQERQQRTRGTVTGAGSAADHLDR